MNKREIVEYIAFDGKVFDNPADCETYEKTHGFREVAEQKLREVAAKINNILKDNNIHLEISEDCSEMLLCFNGHFEDLWVEI